MNKSELINTVSEKTNLPKTLINKVLDAVTCTIKDTLAKGEQVTLVGFGTFYVVERASRKGRNPRTGEPLEIPSSKTAKFRPGKKLKEKLNG